MLNYRGINSSYCRESRFAAHFNAAGYAASAEKPYRCIRNICDERGSARVLILEQFRHIHG